MDSSMPAFPVLHHLLEFAQTPVHRVCDDLQPSHPLLPPFSSCPQPFPASGCFPVSQLFTLGDQRIGTSASASVHWKNWVFRFDFPYDWRVWPPRPPRDSQESSLEPQLEGLCQFGWWRTELGYIVSICSILKWEGTHFHMFRSLYLCWKEGWKLSVYIPYAVSISL